MDEESMWLRLRLEGLWLMAIDVAAAKHAEFVKARGRHYSNEAVAMKVRSLPHRWHAVLTSLKMAAKLMAEEDDDEAEGEEEREVPPVPPMPKVNGNH